jgi:hypothetical protein
VDAISLFALASLASVGFTATSIVKRVMIGVGTSAAAVAVAVLLPVLGDAVDAIAAVIALVLMISKWKRFLINIPNGLACFAIYAVLWEAAGQIPRQFAVVGVHHEFWFFPAVILASAAVGALILVTLSALIGLLGKDLTSSIFYTVGYPWYLVMFIITFFVPDAAAEDAG